MLHKNHLSDAQKYSRMENAKWFYFTHMWWAIKFSFTLLGWAFAMMVHAVFPQLVGFSVLENLVKFLRKMKEQHPDDPILKDLNL
jgi:uncharacterized short protein YbdD (DUF466 family)